MAELQPHNPLDAFKAAIQEKLRDNIGQMMPEEVLAGLVDKSINELFFTPKVSTAPNWNGYGTRPTVEHPSWFNQIVIDLLQPRLERAAKDYIERHSDDLDRMIAEAVERDKLLVIFAQLLGDLVTQGMSLAAGNLLSDLQGRGLLR